MVEAFAKSAGAQLDALVAFIKDNRHLWRAARSDDWATFARIYNGPGYARNRYDVKLGGAGEPSSVPRRSTRRYQSASQTPSTSD